MAEDEVYVYLDSCASKRLFILHNHSCLESFAYSGGSIQTTKLCWCAAKLSGDREIQRLVEYSGCNDAVKNICSAWLLRVRGMVYRCYMFLELFACVTTRK